ncbi:MAG: hypothetical protein ACWGQW_02315 [bacterium]
MGMELIVNVAVQNHPERDGDDLKQRLTHLTRAQAEDIFEAVEGIDYAGLYGDDEPDDVIQHVRGWINEFIDSVYGDLWHRSIVTMQHPDLAKVIAIGGGDSWGDTPDGLQVVGAVAEWGEW